MEQQRQLNDDLLRHRRRQKPQHDNDNETAFSSVVVVKATGTCRDHVTRNTQCLDYSLEADSNSDSGASSMVMSSSSDSGTDSFSVVNFSRTPLS